MARSSVLLALIFVLTSPATAAELTIGPFLQAPRPDGVVVVWETDQASAGAVRVETAPDVFADVPSPTVGTHHEVPLSGFAPGSAHRYRVLLDGQAAGEPGSFVTLPPPGAPVTFAVYGDTRSDPAAHAACIAALNEHPVAFALHTGDLVGSGEIEAQWTEFFRLEAPLVRDVPILPAIGNHDEDHGEPGPPYARLFVPPASGLDHETYYSFQAGNTHVIVLDSQTSVLPEFVCTQVILWWDACLDEAQRAWLEADLAAAAADPTVEHVVVAAHEGPYSSKPGRSGWAELRWLQPWFAGSKVSALFSGHDHLYERGRSPNGLAYVVSGGGGAPLYEAVPEESQEEHPREVLRTEVAYNFQIVEVDGAVLRVRAYECDGTPLEAFEVRAADACSAADDCGDPVATSCPGAWTCDGGRCRWACNGEPECVAAPMCADRAPGEGPGAWACVKGVCTWGSGAALDEPAPPDVASDDTGPPGDAGREAGARPAPDAATSALDAGDVGVAPGTITEGAGGACGVASGEPGAGVPSPWVFALAALVLVRITGRRGVRGPRPLA